MLGKICTKCKKSQPHSEYNRYKEGQSSYWCKSCISIYTKEYNKRILAAPKTIPFNKVCGHCGFKKHYSWFYKCSQRKDGLANWCKKCSAKQNAKYLRENPEKNRMHSRLRKKKIKARRHPLHDTKMELAIEKEKRGRVGEWHTDHILPLSKGGFHHHENLQLLPAKVNLDKGESLEWRDPNYKDWTQLPEFLLVDMDPEDRKLNKSDINMPQV